MTDSLCEFESGLLDLIGVPTQARPFVCEGSPLEAKIFLVGFNPATAMAADFWHFWRKGTGFDKLAWLEAYKWERAEKPLAAGKKYRHQVSTTRRKIERFVELCRPAHVLETNIFAVPSASKAELTRQDRDIEPFRYLLRTIRPNLIVTHGQDAAATLAAMKTNIATISAPHFASRRERANIVAIAEEARSCLAKMGAYQPVV